MNGNSSFIPGTVRIAEIPDQQTSVAVDKQHMKQNKIIPGVVRAVSHGHVRKKTISSRSVTKPPAVPPPKLDAMTQKAIDEIIQETTLRKQRANLDGPSGWRPCPLKKTNKRFLNRTVAAMVNHNERIKKTTIHRSRLKLSALVRSEYNSVQLNKKRTRCKSSKPETGVGTHPPIIDLIDDSD